MVNLSVSGSPDSDTTLRNMLRKPEYVSAALNSTVNLSNSLIDGKAIDELNSSMGITL